MAITGKSKNSIKYPEERKMAKMIWDKAKGRITTREIALAVGVKSSTVASWKRRDDWTRYLPPDNRGRPPVHNDTGLGYDKIRGVAGSGGASVDSGRPMSHDEYELSKGRETLNNSWKVEMKNLLDLNGIRANTKANRNVVIRATDGNLLRLLDDNIKMMSAAIRTANTLAEPEERTNPEFISAYCKQTRVLNDLIKTFASIAHGTPDIDAELQQAKLDKLRKEIEKDDDNVFLDISYDYGADVDAREANARKIENDGYTEGDDDYDYGDDASAF